MRETTPSPPDSSAGAENSKGPAQAQLEKSTAIIRACDEQDVKALVSHATSKGGLLNDDLRQRACMVKPYFTSVSPSNS